MKSGQVTIKDIAKELNISVSTVSRALAGNPLVKPSTKAAVIELAEKLNYQPNYTALSLRNNTTNTLGVIIPQLVHEFFSMVVRGIEDVAYASGYSVIICNSHESYEREVIDSKTLMNGRVDGVLACITKNSKDVSHFKEFGKRSIPLVFFDCVVDDIETDKVIIDDYEASFNAVNHLIETGRSKIAYIGGPISLLINQNRYKGYRDALEKHGIPLNEAIVAHCETGDYADGTTTAKKFVDSQQEFDAIFGATDMLAIGAIKYFKKVGLNIPKDVAAFGFSNWKISELYEPSLSTVDQPGYEMGRIAAELLLKQIKNEDDYYQPTTEVLKTDLIIRESSAAIA